MACKNNPGNPKHFKGSYMWILSVLEYFIIQNDLTNNVFLRLRLKFIKLPAFLLNGSKKYDLFMAERNQFRLHV